MLALQKYEGGIREWQPPKICALTRDPMVTTSIELSDEEGETLMNGNLDDVERQAVVEDLYPKYLEALKDMK